MAVKKSTVPSPKEVKTSTKSFTSEEISSINQLRQAIETATYQFGQIKINQIKLAAMRRLYFTEEHWRKEGWCLPPHFQII